MLAIRSTFTLSVASLAWIVAGCGGESGAQDPAAARPPLVEAVEARFGALPIEEIVPGVVRAHNQVGIRPDISGRIVEVLVRSGDAVKQGQPLVRLDEVEARERLRQAEADVRLAESAAIAARARVTELEARVSRTRALAEQDLVSDQDLETQEAQLDALRASADEATARVEQSRAAVLERSSALEKTIVRAPVAGRLGERRAEVGMLVDPSTLLFVVGDLTELIVEVDLTEGMLGRINEGLPVIIQARSVDIEPIRAELSRISPFLAAESFTTRGEIDVDNRNGVLRPGMFVSVRILVGESRRATLVPTSALWEDPGTGRRGIFVVKDSVGLEPAAVPETDTPGETRGVVFATVEVLAEGRGAAGITGLEEGEWVVTVGQHLLSAELRAARSRGEVGEGARARIRPVAWNRVIELQNLQDEDLLEGFLDKQRKVAAALGAEIPESEDAVDQVLEEAAAARAAQSQGGS